MVALYTQHDRDVHRLRCAIEQQERFVDDADDERVRDFHRARIATLRVKLDQLMENEQ
jgi:hypothetical protein